MKYRIALSVKSISDAIQRNEAFIRDIKRRCNEFCEKMARLGQKVAIERIEEYGATDTRQLVNGVSVEQIDDGHFRLSVYAEKGGSGNYAVYVEYGTGKKGAESPHPEAGAIGWEYDVKGHGDDGWFYPYGPGRHKYKYNPDTGKLQPWTDGEPAKPFFYDAKQEIINQMANVAKEVFSR